MRMWKIAAALAPLLVTAMPVTAQPTSTARARSPAAPTVTARAEAVAPTPGVLVGVPKIQLEVTGGVGITVMTMSKWTAPIAPNDWNTMNYWGAARILLPVLPGLRLGVEAGYHYHFWYNYYPGGTSYPYQYDVTATHVAALVRLPVAPLFTLDLGGAMHFFNNAGTHPGALAALNINVPAGKITFPVGVRADAIFTDPMILPVVLNAGVRLSL
jgi:hypothetical protein